MALGQGTVFNLPECSTLKQAQVNIVDSQWLGPTVPLPEPGSELFLPAGAGALWMGCRLN